MRFSTSLLMPLAGWAITCLLAIAMLAVYEFRQAETRFTDAGQALLRALAQRTAQHDVVLTSLSAFAGLEPQPGSSDATAQATFSPLVESIRRFYPRIRRIDIVDLSGPARTIFNSGEGSFPGVNVLAGKVAERKPGQAFVPVPSDPRLYRIAKRASGSGKAGLFLTIDFGLLAEPPLAFPDGTQISLLLAGKPVYRAQRAEGGDDAARAYDRPLTFVRQVPSRSQPFQLRIEAQVRPASLLQPLPAIAIIGSSALVWALGWLAFLQRKAVLEARRLAELKEYEARLAHASRINAQGELVSAIAHELAQPLTSLLSQTQAGARLAKADTLDRSAVSSSLETSARMAKRAGDILSRLRAYISDTPPERETLDLVAIARGVCNLMERDLSRRGIRFVMDPPDSALLVHVERIGIEQVIHNLLRNAADAVEQVKQGGGEIRVRMSREGNKIRLQVCDNGAGIAPEILPRLFEPFFTTKQAGMGLGLSLSERLADDNDGELHAQNLESGGAMFTLTLPAADNRAGDNR